MVKYVPDRTGRFSQRPHYEPKELDRECENIIAGFLKERHGAAKYPVSTDDLTVLIERDTELLDQFADLSGYGRNVEGLTHFQPGRKPRVRISASLAGDENRQNRLRTTLAHEYGRGAIILDPFGGSGTTMIAAQKSGRLGRLIEYDPAYCDVILRRFEAMTGSSAILARTGQTFEDVAAASTQPET